MNEVATTMPPLDRRKGSLKRDQFVLHYVMSKGNAAEAARQAGYPARTARQMAYKIMKDARVREAIIKLAYESTLNLKVEGTMVLQELAAIAFSPITPGYISAGEKTKALNLLGVHLKLWEGSRGDRIINFNILEIDMATL